MSYEPEPSVPSPQHPSRRSRPTPHQPDGPTRPRHPPRRPDGILSEVTAVQSLPADSAALLGEGARGGWVWGLWSLTYEGSQGAERRLTEWTSPCHSVL